MEWSVQFINPKELEDRYVVLFCPMFQTKYDRCSQSLDKNT